MRNRIVSAILLTALAAIATSGRAARAAALTDGVSSTVSLASRPGVIEATGQQNLHPRFGLLAGYQREDIDGTIYSGWRFGADVLAARWLADQWKTSAVVAAGIGGMKGPVHDHSDVWGRLDAEWENRRLLVAASVELQRGNRMPGIEEGRLRAGYSPTLPEVKSIQPWLLLDWVTRSGAGAPQAFTLLRLMGGAWWIEIGTSLSSADRILSFAISL